jgi:hypothetical protein
MRFDGVRAPDAAGLTLSPGAALAEGAAPAAGCTGAAGALRGGITSRRRRSA